MQLPDFVPTTRTGLLPCYGQSALFDHPATADQAAALCTECPVRTACDTWATQRAEWGTWAGRTDNDRGTPRAEFADAPVQPVRITAHCGTDAARLRHMGRQETCVLCEQAYAARVLVDRLERLTAEHQREGGPTRAGYRLHLRLGIPSCAACRAAHAEHIRAVKAGARSGGLAAAA